MTKPASIGPRFAVTRPTMQGKDDFLTVFGDVFSAPDPEDQVTRDATDCEVDILFNLIAANCRMRGYFEDALRNVSTKASAGVADGVREQSEETWMRYVSPGQATASVENDDDVYGLVDEFVRAHNTVLVILREEADRQRNIIRKLLSGAQHKSPSSHSAGAAAVES